MSSALLMLFLLWSWLAWTSISSTERSRSLNVLAPIRRRNCSNENVQCLDDCSFLCIEDSATCIGGVCVIDKNKSHSIDCKREFGGMVVLALQPTKHWNCVCTDPAFYGGKDCSVLVEDVCKNGNFLYKANGLHECICNYPYRKIVKDGKPYCVEPALVQFFTHELL